ncbi:MAG TPA: hypothetical protein VK348_06550 [Planctomycetota bacterium]|nr:hypothetical protein [Planctomycetota bacterium]
MRALSENQFHTIMAALVVGSLLLDRAAPKLLPTWSPPLVGVITFALGLVWVALFAAHRFRNLGERIRVLEDRLDRTSRKADLLEDDARRRRGLP